MNRLTRRDWILSGAIGALLAISPLSSPNLGMSIGLGAAAAAAYLAVVAYGRRGTRSGSAVDDSSDLPDSATAPAESKGLLPTLSLTSGLCLVLFVAFFAPTMQWLYTSWTMSVWINTHGLFIPPIMLYLGYEILRRETRPTPESSPWGLAFLIPGLTLAVVDSTMQTQYIAVVGMVLCLPGLSLLLLGERRTRLLAFPLFLGVFMIPIPGTFNTTLLLREYTAVGTEALLQLQGMSVIRSSTLLELPWGTVSIAKACSGLSTLYSSLTVASILVYYSQTRKRKWIIIALTVPLALAANVVRALFLVVASHNFGTEILDTQLHEASGVATFAVVLATLYFVSDMPRRTRQPA